MIELTDLTDETNLEAFKRARENQDKVMKEAERDYGAEQTELAEGEYRMMKIMKMTTDELINAVLDWGEEHNLHDPKAQLNKVIEEVGEIAHEVSRNRYGEDFRDAIGDSLVTIIILANIAGQDPRACLLEAYNTIKNRKGHTENGSFVKEQ